MYCVTITSLSEEYSIAHNTTVRMTYTSKYKPEIEAACLSVVYKKMNLP